MRVISINTNGIRAAAKKGFYEWLHTTHADIVCIQETKAQEDQLTHEQFKPDDYFCHYHDAVKKGYSGVAIYSKVRPKKSLKAWAGTISISKAASLSSSSTNSA